MFKIKIIFHSNIFYLKNQNFLISNNISLSKYLKFINKIIYIYIYIYIEEI